MLVHNGTDAYVETGVCLQFPVSNGNCLADVATFGNSGGVDFIIFSAISRLGIDGVDKS